MRKSVQAFGAVALATAAVGMSLAGTMGVSPPDPTSPGGLLGTVGGAAVPALAVGYVTTREARRALLAEPGAGVARPSTAAWRGVAVVAAAPLTRWLAIDCALGAVVAAALVGLLAHLVVPDYAVPAYCGAFVGMAGPDVLPGYAAVAGAGTVAGAVFLATERVFDGFGGKLGTTAFVGCTGAALAAGTAGPSAGTNAPATAAVCVTVAAVAAVATFAISVRLDHGPVVGSAVVGLLAGLVAPSLLPAGECVAAAAFCASFAGMARPDRLPNEAATLLAGLLSGALFLGAAPYFAGFGGKLGTVAFVACLWTYGLYGVLDTLGPLGTGLPRERT